jgi:hypothetical protein
MRRKRDFFMGGVLSKDKKYGRVDESKR